LRLAIAAAALTLRYPMISIRSADMPSKSTHRVQKHSAKGSNGVVAKTSPTNDRAAESDDSHGMAQIRELTHGREGRAVVAALATGFSLGVVLGGVIAGSRRRKGWPEKVADEGYLRQLLERIEQLVPDSISKKLSD
jgi:hypothetical protein